MIQKIKNLLAKETTLIVVLSLIITLAICSLIGIAGYVLLNQFWASFILAFIGQFLVFAIYNTNLIRKDRIEYAQLINEQLNAIGKYNIQVSCAYCRQNNTTPVLLNQENRFTCEYCKQVSGIKMQFISTQLTIPLEKVVLPGSEDSEAVVFKVNTTS
jgi:hypothetical protein